METQDESLEDCFKVNRCERHAAAGKAVGVEYETCADCYTEARITEDEAEKSARSRMERIDRTAMDLYVQWWRDVNYSQPEERRAAYGDYAYKYALALESARARFIESASPKESQ